MKHLTIALALLWIPSLTARAAPPAPAPFTEPDPEITKERVVFHTIAGDLVFSLFPKVAPRTVRQFMTLVRQGVYDGTHFYRVEPNFLIQLGVAQDRLHPMTKAQRSLIEKLPGEFSKDLKHHVFTLSMAHENDKPDSGETSFSIMLNDAPHLDGRYTIFGRLEQGVQTLFELLKVSRDSGNRPSTRLTVLRAEVIDAAKVATYRPKGPVPVRDLNSSDDVRVLQLRRTMSLGLLFLIALSLAAFFFRAKLSARHMASVFLVQVLVAAFLAMPLLIPLGQDRAWLAPLVFLGFLGLFRVLAKFESA